MQNTTLPCIIPIFDGESSLELNDVTSARGRILRGHDAGSRQHSSSSSPAVGAGRLRRTLVHPRGRGSGAFFLSSLLFVALVAEGEVGLLFIVLVLSLIMANGVQRCCQIEQCHFHHRRKLRLKLLVVATRNSAARRLCCHCSVGVQTFAPFLGARGQNEGTARRPCDAHHAALLALCAEETRHAFLMRQG